MKRILASSFALLCLPFSANAADGYATLTVEFVGAASATHPLAVVRSMPSFGFESTVQLGACPLAEGKVYFEGNVEDTAIMAVLLASQATGRPVRIYWDDTHVNSRGYCKLTGVREY